MINLIRSIKLRAITPGKTSVNFDREKVIKGQGEIELTIQSELSENADKEQCKLTFSAIAQSKSSPEDAFLNIEFSVDYIFDITDKDSYNAMSTDERGCLCANLVFMDYRLKLKTVLATVGMTSLKLPISLIDISDS